MRRLAAATLLTLALVAGAVFSVGAAGRGDGSKYQVRAIFDDVASAVPGEDVKIAGAKVGKVGAMDVTPEKKAAVVLEITDSGFSPFHQNAHCTIRPQSLIGEKYVECTPGTPSTPGLNKIKDGEPGAGQHLLPLSNTSAPVDLDLVNNIMRLPYRERFSIILSELGAGLAGRGGDLNRLIHRANPALRQTDRVLKQLADENVTLKNLASQSDRALAPLARDRRHLSGFIKNANDVGEATAAQSADIQRGIARLPRFLRELKPTLEDLGQLADEMTPTLADLDRASPSLTRLVLQLGPFSRSATRSLVSLGKTTDVGGPVLQRARPVVKDLKAFAHSAKPVSAKLDALTASLDKTGGLEQAMNYVFFQMTAINGFDEISHYLRAALLVNTCSSYATQAIAGCGAHFTETKTVQASSTSTANPVAALANGGNAPATAAQLVKPQAAPAPSAGQRKEVRTQAAGGRDEALLNYLMGSG